MKIIEKRKCCYWDRSILKNYQRNKQAKSNMQYIHIYIYLSMVHNSHLAISIKIMEFPQLLNNSLFSVLSIFSPRATIKNTIAIAIKSCAMP